MNNNELDRLLKSAPIPDRPDEFWKAFPSRVTAEIGARRRSDQRKVAVRLSASQQRGWRSLLQNRPAMASACAAAILLIGALIVYHTRSTPTRADTQFAELQKCFREIESLFPRQIKVIVFHDRGAELVLAEAADVPTSAPIYLRVSGPQGSRRFVTFSGQQIRIGGELCDVLVDRQGHVLLVGQQFVWSSSAPSAKTGPYQVEARPLGAT